MIIIIIQIIFFFNFHGKTIVNLQLIFHSCIVSIVLNNLQFLVIETSHMQTRSGQNSYSPHSNSTHVYDVLLVRQLGNENWHYNVMLFISCVSVLYS
jgi:hypothetical protein